MSLFVRAIIVASKYAQMSKQGSAEKKKYGTLTIPQKLGNNLEA
jgi:hypothetical protein